MAVLAICVCLFISTPSFCQNKSTFVTIKAVELQSSAGSDGESLFEYRVNTWFEGSLNSNCIDYNNVPANTALAIPTDDVIRVDNVYVSDASVTLTFEIETWEEDGCGGDCGYRANCSESDEAHCARREALGSLRLIDLVPGNDPTTNFKVSTCDEFNVKFHIEYVPFRPILLQPQVQPSGESNFVLYDNEQLCPTTAVSLGITNEHRSIHQKYITYTWEYWTGETEVLPNPNYCDDPSLCEDGLDVTSTSADYSHSNISPDAPPCCLLPKTITVPIWRTYATTTPANNNGTLLIPDIHELPGIKNSTESQSIQFRAKITANNMSSKYSDAVTVNVSPAGPTIGSITTDASCSVASTGAVHIFGLEGAGSYRSFLRLGDDQTPCSVEDNNCDGGINGSTSIEGQEGHLFDVPGGTYTLVVSNPGGSKGVCASFVYPVAVDVIADNAVGNFSATDVASYGGENGAIAFTTSGGNQDALTYTLNKVDPSPGGTLTDPTIGDEQTKTFGGLSVGLYNLTIEDGGCSPPATVNDIMIRQPNRVEQTEALHTVTATCSSPGNGGVTVSVKRSNGPYDFSPPPITNNYHFKIVDVNSNVSRKDFVSSTGAQTISDLPPGNYQLIVTEENGSEANGVIDSFVIDPPDPVALSSLAFENLKCFEDNSGTIVVSATGGTGSFLFYLSDGKGKEGSSPDGNFLQLQAGSYSLVVRQPACDDHLNYESPIVLSQPPDLTFEITSDDLSCFEANDGAVQVERISGGTPFDPPHEAYENYTWEKLTAGVWSLESTARDIDNLSAGLYRFTASDANACTKTSQVINIEQPDILAITSRQVADIVCFGEQGQLEITGIGGTLPYSIIVSSPDGKSFSSPGTSILVDEGNYTAGLRDAQGCEVIESGSYTITSPTSPLSFNYTQSEYGAYNISCHGSNDGEIVFEPSGGNGSNFQGYYFSIDDMPYEQILTLINIEGGSHNFHLKDGRGCVVTQSIMFSEPSALTVSVSEKENVQCYGINEGLIKLSAYGGTGEYMYQIDEKDFQAAPEFDQLAPGTYQLTVRDMNNCSTTLSEEIFAEHPPIVVVPVIQPVSCNGGSDGAIDLQTSGGAGGYEYKIDGVRIDMPVENVPAGVYDLNVTDSEGCTANVESLQVNEPEPLVIGDVTVQDIKCLGESGRIAMQATGGTLPYTFEYQLDDSGFVSFSGESPMEQGQYHVRVSDNRGCTTNYDTPLRISSPDAMLDFGYTQSDYNGFNISCKGGKNGHITIAAIGGNGAEYSGYQYAIDSNQFSNDKYITQINAGVHAIKVKDQRGCAVEKNIFFSEAEAEMIAVLISQSNVTCVGDADGTVELAATGGASPYSYRVDSKDFQSSNIIEALGIADYTFYVADVNNCVSNLTSSIVALTPAMEISTAVTPVNCFGGSDGKIEVTVTSGISPYIFQWNHTANVSNKVVGLKAADYTLTVTDNAGCSKTETIAVTQPAEPLHVEIQTTAACYGKTDGILTVNTTGGSFPYLYSIDNGANYQEQRSIAVAAGEYAVLVKDINECIANSHVNVGQRNITPEPDFLVASSRNALDTLVLIDISVPRPDSIHWEFDSRAIVISENDWVPQIQFFEEGIYEVKMTCFFGGCDYELSKTLQVSAYDPATTLENKPGYRTILEATVSPNPSDGRFTLETRLSKPSKISLIVYDMLGTVHYRSIQTREQEFTTEIDLTAAAAGIYSLQIVSETDVRELRLSLKR